MPPTLLGAKNEYRKYRIKEKYELLVAFTIRGYFLYPKKGYTQSILNHTRKIGEF